MTQHHGRVHFVQRHIAVQLLKFRCCSGQSLANDGCVWCTSSAHACAAWGLDCTDGCTRGRSAWGHRLAWGAQRWRPGRHSGGSWCYCLNGCTKAALNGCGRHVLGGLQNLSTGLLYRLASHADFALHSFAERGRSQAQFHVVLHFLFGNACLFADPIGALVHVFANKLHDALGGLAFVFWRFSDAKRFAKRPVDGADNFALGCFGLLWCLASSAGASISDHASHAWHNAGDRVGQGGAGSQKRRDLAGHFAFGWRLVECVGHRGVHRVGFHQVINAQLARRLGWLGARFG